MDQGKRTKEAQGENIQSSNKIGGQFKLGNSAHIQDDRLALFEKLYSEQQELIKNAPHPDITITLKDGKQLPGKAFETTPLAIAQKISKKLAEEVMVAKVVYKNRISLGFGDIVDADEEDSKVNNKGFEVWDLSRPLEGDCTLELLKFEDPLGKETFWHSSAHILGASLEAVYGSYLCIGPPLENGFFYDSFMGENKIFTKDYENIEKEYQKQTSAKYPFQKVVLTKNQALELFQANPFKVQLITKKIPEGGFTTAYKCGKLIDLCTGPHLPSTERVKAFKVTKNSAAYWLGKNTNDDLQRVYGISFPDKKQLAEYIRIQEELAKRDHRNVGKQFHLFQFHQLSPGSAFFFPHGAHIYNQLVQFMRREYVIRGFQEVVTPNFYNVHLWKVSGHYDKYKENMFLIPMGEEGEYGVKPMNCPGHCLMFDMVQHSYRDLPIRYADFGVLHRNEVHGALSGLTRVRRFQQDDAHIFCRNDQIKIEIQAALEFLAYVYNVLGFEYKLYLSTRPEKFLGTHEIWDNAEKQLKQSLDDFGKPYEINEGDGAFYGPKIDVKLFDAYKREHQCGTIQLDFNLPERFNLQFRASEDTTEVSKEKKSLQQEKEALANVLIEVSKKSSSQQESPQENPQALNSTVLQQIQGEKCQSEESGHKSEQSDHLSKSQIDSILHEKKYEVTGYHHVKPGFQRPIIIHRAILGSLERMIAILTENCGGKWPFWISPKQVCICPISNKYSEYAEKVCARLRLEGFFVDCDLSDVTLNKKIRNGQINLYNFIAAVGAEEAENGTIDVRDRDKNDRIGKFTIEEFITFLQKQGIPDSDQLSEVKQKAFYRKLDEELHQYDNELKLKMFLEGDGLEVGAKDHEIYAKVKDVKLNENHYPNLSRWFKYINNLKVKEQPVQQQ